MTSPNDDKNKNILLQYAGLATQFLVGIGISVFIGIKVDAWLHLSFPLLVWMLPLLIIVGMLLKIIKDTSTKK